MKKTTDRAAKFYGICQICGHDQKLPNDRLSLHGYSVRWNCFVGECPGSKELPFEVSKDLIEAAILRSIEAAKNLRAAAVEKRAMTSPKNLKMTVYASDVRNAKTGERVGTYGFFGQKISSATTHGDLTKKGDQIEYRFSRQGEEYIVMLGMSQGVHAGTKVSEIVKKLNDREADEFLANAKNHDSYVVWQRERIANWKPQALRPVPESERGSQPTIHAVGEYWTKRAGRTIALCSSSARSNGYKQTTDDRSKVTCKACLKYLVSMDADAVEAKAAEKLVAEMVAKYGPSTTETFSEANRKAIKELRYDRKEIEKNIRKRATDRLERGQA